MDKTPLKHDFFMQKTLTSAIASPIRFVFTPPGIQRQTISPDTCGHIPRAPGAFLFCRFHSLPKSGFGKVLCPIYFIAPAIFQYTFRLSSRLRKIPQPGNFYCTSSRLIRNNWPFFNRTKSVFSPSIRSQTKKSARRSFNSFSKSFSCVRMFVPASLNCSFFIATYLLMFFTPLRALLRVLI